MTVLLSDIRLPESYVDTKSQQFKITKLSRYYNHGNVRYSLWVV